MRDIALAQLAFLGLLLIVGLVGHALADSEARLLLIPVVVVASSACGYFAVKTITRRRYEEMLDLLKDPEDTLQERIEKWLPRGAVRRVSTEHAFAAFGGFLVGLSLAVWIWLPEGPGVEPVTPDHDPAPASDPAENVGTGPASPGHCYTTSSCFILWLSCEGGYECDDSAPVGCNRGRCTVY